MNAKLSVLFIFIFLQTVPRLSAQVEWYKHGEVFYFEVTTGIDFENYGIHSMTYFTDTVINSHMLKLLRYTDKRGNHTEIFIRQVGEKVHYYTPFFNAFKLMYDFTAMPGDTAPFKGYTVDKTGTIEIGTTTRKTQTWKKANKQVLVIEGIGMVGFPPYTDLYICSPPVPFLGCIAAFDGQDYFFRCMKSEDLDFDPYGTCVALDTKDEEADSLTIFPNPTSDRVIIKSKHIFDAYAIYDLNGNKVDHQTITPSLQTTYNVEIPPALYILQIYKEGNIFGTIKLVVLP